MMARVLSQLPLPLLRNQTIATVSASALTLADGIFGTGKAAGLHLYLTNYC